MLDTSQNFIRRDLQVFEYFALSFLQSLTRGGGQGRYYEVVSSFQSRAPRILYSVVYRGGNNLYLLNVARCSKVLGRQNLMDEIDPITKN